MNSLLDALGYAGESLGKGGRAVRGLLGGKPNELLNLVPFSDAMGLTNPEDAVSGNALLQQLGMGNSPWLGMGVDILSDPLTYIPPAAAAKFLGLGKFLPALRGGRTAIQASHAAPAVSATGHVVGPADVLAPELLSASRTLGPATASDFLGATLAPAENPALAEARNALREFRPQVSATQSVPDVAPEGLRAIQEVLAAQPLRSAPRPLTTSAQWEAEQAARAISEPTFPPGPSQVPEFTSPPAPKFFEPSIPPTPTAPGMYGDYTDRLAILKDALEEGRTDVVPGLVGEIQDSLEMLSPKLRPGTQGWLPGTFGHPFVRNPELLPATQARAASEIAIKPWIPPAERAGRIQRWVGREGWALSSSEMENLMEPIQSHWSDVFDRAHGRQMGQLLEPRVYDEFLNTVMRNNPGADFFEGPELVDDLRRLLPQAELSGNFSHIPRMNNAEMGWLRQLAPHPAAEQDYGMAGLLASVLWPQGRPYAVNDRTINLAQLFGAP